MDRKVIGNTIVKRELLSELEQKGQGDKRGDLIAIRHKVRGIVQDLTFMRLRHPGLEKALEHLESAQAILEAQTK